MSEPSEHIFVRVVGQLERLMESVASAASSDEATRDVLNVMYNPLKEQLTGLMGGLVQAGANGTTQQLRSAVKLVDAAALELAVDGAVDAVGSAAERGFLGRVGEFLINFLQEVVFLIKKLILAIVRLLKLDLPWLVPLLVIIDEIIKKVLAILGIEYDVDVRAIERMLSDAEGNFLREMAAVEEFEAARAAN